MPILSARAKVPMPAGTEVPDRPGTWLGAMTRLELVSLATGYVATFSDLAGITDPLEGQHVLALDTHIEYRYDGAAWTIWNAPWQNLSLATDWTGVVGNIPQVCMRGGMVCVRGAANHSTGGSNITAFTLPAGYRPGSSGGSGTLSMQIEGANANLRVQITSAGVTSVTTTIIAAQNCYFYLTFAPA